MYGFAGVVETKDERIVLLLCERLLKEPVQ
jgi:hypothetical protein